MSNQSLFALVNKALKRARKGDSDMAVQRFQDESWWNPRLNRNTRSNERFTRDPVEDALIESSKIRAQAEEDQLMLQLQDARHKDAQALERFKTILHYGVVALGILVLGILGVVALMFGGV